jgi:acyl-CoA thioesterase FadM
MNLWLRVVWLFVTSWFRPRLKPPFDASIVDLIVLPNDLDVYAHMNNGRYLAIMDLGRMDCFLRCGLFQAARAAGWNPVLSAAQVRFRRELRLFQKFRLETRILYWEETTFVMEHRILIDMNGRRDVVPVADLFARMNVDAVSPPASEAVSAFLAAEEALKRAA